jgi:hypothetical protein
MSSLYPHSAHCRNRRQACPVAAELARVRAMPAVRRVANRFELPLATALLIAQAAGLYVGDDR